MSLLFSSIRLRGAEMRNRLFVSPMCQYSATDGVPQPWHLVHLGARAVGGAGMVIAEATSVSAEGRISPGDVGLWNEAQVEAWQPITAFIAEQGAVPAVQLAHAGRKASTLRPWEGNGPVPTADGGWIPVAASPLPYSEKYPTPTALDEAGVQGVIDAFRAAAAHAVLAGFGAVEVHAAHGYLLHEFLSPHTNKREDGWGGTFEGRIRLAMEVTRAVRGTVPESMPVLVRLSCEEYVPGGWDLEQTVELASRLAAEGVDLIDCSSGGNLPQQQLRPYPGYQVPFARAVRQRAGVPTGAVGLLTEPHQVEGVLASGDADAILMGREFLRDPYWPLHAAAALRDEVAWPVQYQRAKP